MVMTEEEFSTMVTGMKGYDDWYSISELLEYLNDGGGDLVLDLDSTEEKYGWVFRGQSEIKIKEAIERVLVETISSITGPSTYYLIQFWEPKAVGDDGECVQLTTSGQPFALRLLQKGLCWYRKRCMNYSYSFSTKGGAEKAAEELGPVGRAYRSKYPESSPDLRLYSSTEFPLANYAGRCGVRNYLALPIFDLHDKERNCYGVLEFLSPDDSFMEDVFSYLEQRLKEAGLRSAHTGFVPVLWYARSLAEHEQQQRQPKTEITKMLELTMEVFPQLHLAQAWVPCTQCADNSTSTPNMSKCMVRTAFATSEAKIVNSFKMTFHHDLFQYTNACGFHSQQKVVSLDQKESWFCRNVCHSSISENPLAHYAQKAMLSSCLTVFLESVCNTYGIYLVEFFLQSNYTSNEHEASFVQSLAGIIETEFKSFFKLKSQPKPNPQSRILKEEINMVMKEYDKEYSFTDFIDYWQESTLYWLKPSKELRNAGWVFLCPMTKILSPSQSGGEDDLQEKIVVFMSQIIRRKSSYCLVQFWEPKVLDDDDDDDGCYLITSDQPFVVGCLEEGLACFRKKSMEVYYRVDEKAKEEQVGAIGRAFRSGDPEFTPDLRFYSDTEFPLRNCAARCCLREYVALPVFDRCDAYQRECLGVLEFVQFTNFSFKEIQRQLQAVGLCSRSLPLHMQRNVNLLLPAENSLRPWNDALSEIRGFLEVVTRIPQLHMVEVWSSCTRCDSKSSCMERTHSRQRLEDVHSRMHEFYHLHTRKGISAMVLASNYKSCFFRNSGRFNITEHPLSHYMQRCRFGPCYAICLQSSHTGNHVYVLEFFMKQGPAKCEYVLSFLNCLLPIMMEKLESFTLASGKKLLEELVIEVHAFPGEERLDLLDIDQLDMFPRNFRFVEYIHKEEHQTGGDEQDNTVSSSSLGREMNAGGLHLKTECVNPYPGKRLKDVEEELCGGRSSIKRACRDYGIYRCPGLDKYEKNEMECADEDVVMIHATYKNMLIKFPSSLKSGLDKIKEPVARKFNLEMENFMLECLDEDNDRVLLTGDDDLHLCAVKPTPSGNTSVQLFVRSIHH